MRRRHDGEGWRWPELGGGGVLERLGEGEGWNGSGILEVAFIGARVDTGGAAGERKGRHQWRPVRELMGIGVVKRH
jgi:hypothetical protein